jgi:hypothetical protein
MNVLLVPNGADFSMVQLKYARRLSTREGKSIILPEGGGPLALMVQAWPFDSCNP